MKSASPSTKVAVSPLLSGVEYLSTRLLLVSVTQTAPLLSSRTAIGRHSEMAEIDPAGVENPLQPAKLVILACPSATAATAPLAAGVVNFSVRELDLSPTKTLPAESTSRSFGVQSSDEAARLPLLQLTVVKPGWPKTRWAVVPLV